MVPLCNSSIKEEAGKWSITGDPVSKTNRSQVWLIYVIPALGRRQGGALNLKPPGPQNEVVSSEPTCDIETFKKNFFKS